MEPAESNKNSKIIEVFLWKKVLVLEKNETGIKMFYNFIFNNNCNN